MTFVDWSQGGDTLCYQHCGGCGHVWYFRRDFCPSCGQRGPATRASAGLGTVQAGTLVHRAPNDDFRALAPYRIVLVNLEEGFRAMGHGDPALAIGDRVRCSVRTLASRNLPYFDKDLSA